MMIKKLLPLLFLFAGFQAQATLVYSQAGPIYSTEVHRVHPYSIIATVTTDARIYTTSFGCAGSLLCYYEEALAATLEGGDYQGHRLATVADVNYFTRQIFDGFSPSCDPTVNGIFQEHSQCIDEYYAMDTQPPIFPLEFRYLTGDSARPVALMFTERSERRRGSSLLAGHAPPGDSFTAIQSDDWMVISSRTNRPSPWLLVTDVAVQGVAEPSLIALMVLGLVGIGFARRHQS
jgi:hypothetical protein